MEEKGLWQQEGSIYMARCPKCGRENYTPNVLTGICAWCGYNANKHAEELGFNNTRIASNMDEKEQKLRELLKNLGKLVPTLLVVGITADKHGALFMGSPEENDEKRAEDVATSVAMMMEYNAGARQILLAAVSHFLQQDPDYQRQMREALDIMERNSITITTTVQDVRGTVLEEHIKELEKEYDEHKRTHQPE